MKKLTTLILVLALSAALLIGCAAPTQIAPQAMQHTASLEIQPQLQLTGGVLCLKINPEIAVHYDENGKVTKSEGRNPEGIRLVENFSGYVGKETSQVLEELVQVIGQAGYFVEEAEGKARKIVLELDPGSQVPHDQFLEDMAQHVKLCVESKNWTGEREFDYDQQPTQPTTPATTQPVASGKQTTDTTVPAGNT